MASTMLRRRGLYWLHSFSRSKELPLCTKNVPVGITQLSKSSRNALFISNHHSLHISQHMKLKGFPQVEKPWLTVTRTLPERSLKQFHTSHRLDAPPLLVLMIFKSFAKVSAVISGRAFRQWWKSLPKHKTQYFLDFVQRNIWKIMAGVAGMCVLCGAFYTAHLEQTPITNRTRFLALNNQQLADIIEVECKQHLKEFEGLLLPPSHPLYKVVSKVTMLLLKGNQDLHQIRDRTWTIHLVNKDVKNAFVLPNGHIFVFTGLFKAVKNDQQLGIVLAHEISHVVLNHSAEQISFFEFLDFFLIIFLGAIWAILPNDGLAIVATWFKNKVVELLLKMPYSRLLETEADEVGLQIAAKACLDVRESQVFWESMSKNSPDTEEIAFLSTHPSHLQRAKHLGDLIPQAIRVREFCGCAPLPIRDPRYVNIVKPAVGG